MPTALPSPTKRVAYISQETPVLESEVAALGDKGSLLLG